MLVGVIELEPGRSASLSSTLSLVVARDSLGVGFLEGFPEPSAYHVNDVPLLVVYETTSAETRKDRNDEVGHPAPVWP